MQSKLEANEQLWESKFTKYQETFDSELKKANKKFDKEVSEKEARSKQELKDSEEKHKAQLSQMESKFTSLKKEHDKEVKELFENVGTLKFVKELRFFKKQWKDQKTEKKRKKIAAAMANATKGWVGDSE